MEKKPQKILTIKNITAYSLRGLSSTSTVCYHHYFRRIFKTLHHLCAAEAMALRMSGEVRG